MKKAGIPSWVKFGTRLIDCGIFYLLIAASIEFLPFYLPDWSYLAIGAVVPFLWIPLEKIVLKKMGITLGRALFGVFKSRPHRWADRIVGAIAGVCCLLAALCSTPWSPVSVNLSSSFAGKTDWTPYTSSTKGFRIHMPGDPTHQSSNVEIPHVSTPLEYKEVKSEGNYDAVYAVGYIDLPRKWKFFGSKNILKGAVRLVEESSPDVEVLSQALTRHNTHPALDFHYRQGSDEVKGRLILIGTTLYKVTVSYPIAIASKDLKMDEFIQSFLHQT